MNELKPCPFCGSKASIIEVAERPDKFVEEAFIQCEECGFSIHHKWLSVEILIEYWNKRAERTCTVEGYDTGYEWDIDDTYYQVDDPKFTLSCGHEAYGSVEPNFCPVCGARVVEDE